MSSDRPCPVCESHDLLAFFELPDMPVVCNQLFASRDEALGVERGDLRLVVCRSCGFVFNRAFEAERVPYGAAYENSLHFSPSFRAYAEKLARRLIDRYALRHHRVVEIACGNAEFLSLLCELGDNRGTGFDPSGVLERGQVPSQRVELVPEYFSEAHAAVEADLICCRHALEHMEDPLGFLGMLRRALEGRETVLYFEVPNATWILEEFDLWDLIYEHFGYFTPESLRRIFERAGFEVLALEEDFGRQFLGIEARVGVRDAGAAGDAASVVKRAAAFARTCNQRVSAWRERLAGLDGCAAVWGAGSKGITFLNLFREIRALRYAIDVNPHKCGMYVSGSGHGILAPVQAAAEAPDLVVVMNPLYREEIREELARLEIVADVRPA